MSCTLAFASGYVGVATISTLLETNKIARDALVWAQAATRTHFHDSFCVVGWSDASWACRHEGSSQGGHMVGITNTAFLEQAECKVIVISWHSGKLARVARSSNAAELQTAADAERQLTNISLSHCEIFGGTAPEEYTMRSNAASHRA